MILDTIKFDENGLVPAVLQDAKSGQILMVAYMNRESLEKTISSGKAVFYSRSRKTLWLKGETSGNYMNVETLWVDCDMDCLLLKVTPEGPACHTGKNSCFYRKLEADKFVEREEGGIRQPFCSKYMKRFWTAKKTIRRDRIPIIYLKRDWIRF